MNHVQLVEEDAFALVSCRLADHVILYYDVANRTVVWSSVEIKNVQDTFNMVHCQRMWRERSARLRDREQR